jgi:cytochrome oxidase Cu insertion factor (SCO1/SenC/PrrC family)
MRRPLAALLLILLIAALVLPQAGPAAAGPLDELLAGLNLVPLRGAAPPGLTLERLADGKRISLSDLRGRPVIVYFWATW